MLKRLTLYGKGIHFGGYGFISVLVYVLEMTSCVAGTRLADR